MALELVNKLPYDHPYRWDGTAVGGVKLWRPDELGADLALWLDAADASTITLNGSNVSQWDDKSGNGKHVSQGEATLQPQYDSFQLNSLSTISFVDDILGTSSPLSEVATDWSYTGVMNFTESNPSTADAFLSSNTSASGTFQMDIRSVGGNNALSFSGKDDGGENNTPTALYQNPYNTITGILYCSVDSTGVKTSFNGVQVDSSTATFRTGMTVPVRLGVNRAGANFLNANHAEHVFTTSVLPTADRQKLEGYLAWKWGLTANLPVDHPYKTTPPIA